MSYKDIEDLIDLFKELSVVIESGNKEAIKEKLEEIKEFNQEVQADAQEYGLIFTLQLTNTLNKYLYSINRFIEDSGKCQRYASTSLDLLRSFEKIQDVLKRIINENIAPTLKRWGFKKNGNNFIMQTGEYIKLLEIQSSRFNNYETVKFTFNLIISKGSKKVESTRVGILRTGRYDHWYELTPISINEVKIQIENDLIKYVKPFFDKY